MSGTWVKNLQMRRLAIVSLEGGCLGGEEIMVKKILTKEGVVNRAAIRAGTKQSVRYLLWDTEKGVGCKAKKEKGYGERFQNFWVSK